LTFKHKYDKLYLTHHQKPKGATMNGPEGSGFTPAHGKHAPEDLIGAQKDFDAIGKEGTATDGGQEGSHRSKDLAAGQSEVEAYAQSVDGRKHDTADPEPTEFPTEDKIAADRAERGLPNPSADQTPKQWDPAEDGPDRQQAA
jgi:hypothetical protein